MLMPTDDEKSFKNISEYKTLGKEIEKLWHLKGYYRASNPRNSGQEQESER